MSVIDSLMVWVFWIGLFAIVFFDVVLAIDKHQTFSQKAKAAGKCFPVIAYFAGILPTHFWYPHPIAGGWIAVVMIASPALAIVCLKHGLGVNIHPALAFVIGLPIGLFFFPN